MKKIRMTDRWLRSLSVKVGREEFADAIVPGLRLRVSSRSKKWSVMTRIEKKLRRVQLGDAADLGLLEARQSANKILDGNDTSKTAAIATDAHDEGSAMLETLCAGYVLRMEKKGQPSADEYRRALIDRDYSFCNFMMAKLGRPAIASEVIPEHVSDWLRGIYNNAPSHARHCRAYLHAAFEWALKAEFDYTTTDKGSFSLSANPVSATPGGAKSKARNRVLSKKELKTLWTLLPKAAEPRTATCIRLIIAMGGVRITEICRSEWDWYADDWLTVPKTKNAREHLLPLTVHGSEQFALAKALSVSDSRFLFPHQLDDDKSLLVTSIGRVARRLIEDFDLEPFQMRDLRRTFKTQLLDGEYVEEREIDIWHNHGQNADIARKHYTWAEYKNLKQRVASQIDAFLKDVGI